MENTIERAYYICLAIVGAWVLYLAVSFKLDLVQQAPDYGFQMLTPKETHTYQDNNSPVGIRQEFLFDINGISENYNYLIFYSYHENVKVYLDSERVYKLEAVRNKSIGKSPGCVWNGVFFHLDDNGKSLRVILYPAYKSAIGWVPEFYFGNRYDIYKRIVAADMPDILLSVLSIFVGGMYITFGFINYRNSEAGNGLVKLGIFAILIGVWKLMDTETIGFLVPRAPVLFQLNYVALLFIVVPFVSYIRELFEEKYQKIWNMICTQNLIVVGIVVILQFIKLADFRQTLFLTHFEIGIAIIFTVILSIYQGTKEGWSPKLKSNFQGMLVCFLGALLDMVTYYFTRGAGTLVLAMFCFEIYVIVLGFSTLKEAKALLAIGAQAQHYEEVAYHDQLTGLLNRSAYAEAIASGDYSADRTIVVMLDLNDLKKCNDQLGHDKGDIYIRESARIIRTCFGTLGNCYRTGGDEFCVLIRNGSLEECRKSESLLREYEKEFNASGQGVYMQIALGYGVYDKRVDYDLLETIRRADKAMYENKAKMKQGTIR